MVEETKRKSIFTLFLFRHEIQLPILGFWLGTLLTRAVVGYLAIPKVCLDFVRVYRT